MKRSIVLAAVVPAVFAACGGGGGGGGNAVPATPPAAGATAGPSPAPSLSATIVIGLPTPAPSASPSSTPSSSASSAPSPSPSPFAVTVTGTVMQIPVDAYGPIAMNGAMYASADAAQTAPLANATVVIGPQPLTGATPPALLPTGDLAVVTTASGAFSGTLSTLPAAPIALEPFVIPSNDILGFVAPASGYYVEVFPASGNGTQAGSIIPLHRFVSAASPIELRVSTIASAEAAALALINSDRATYGGGALTFDESAEEIARLHANDEAAGTYTCHYDTHNIGPSSRYLAAGGIGLTGENLALSYGPDASSAMQNAESAFIAERSNTPPGGHYLNLVDATHVWAGIAAVQYASAPGFFEIDDELITPNGQSAVVGSSGYGTAGSCSPGTIVNNS